MTEYMETITRRVTIDEKTGEKEVVELSHHQSFPITYKYIVKRYNAIDEEGFDTSVRVFESKKECVDWINSLEFGPAGVFGSCEKATVNNLTRATFRISINEPQCAAFADRYNNHLDNYIAMRVLFSRD